MRSFSVSRRRVFSAWKEVRKGGTAAVEVLSDRSPCVNFSGVFLLADRIAIVSLFSHIRIVLSMIGVDPDDLFI
ncbi:hypothetical protein KFK09_015071 [Dendrobium nobile]|uniref:Uncharacterized protein n=1 Tax=Dendrobium nobile TaxID=94219 RepID=A0A8T3B669_DENNO|nr:hypothetical protein KFK09_015071 [Dendrobium nobile]